MDGAKLVRDGLEVLFVVAIGGMLWSVAGRLRRGQLLPTLCPSCGRPSSRAHPRCRHCGWQDGAVAGSAFVVAWDEDTAIDLAGRLSQAGWLVALEHADRLRAWRRIKEGRPDVVVVDLSRQPSAGRELLRAMGQRKHTSAIPVVTVGGEDGVAGEDVAAAAANVVSGHS